MFRFFSAAAAVTGALSTTVKQTDEDPCFCGPPPNSALIVIDMQYDFIPGGSLEVPKGDEIIGTINNLAKLNWSAPVGYSIDYHPHDSISFASAHGKNAFETVELTYVKPHGGAILCEGTDTNYKTKYREAVEADCTGKDTEKFVQMLWPDHCVQNTRGGALHDEIMSGMPENSYTFRKGYTTVVDSYSAFNNVLNIESTNLHQILEGHGVKNVFVVGLAQDFCVHFTATDAVTRGYKSYVIDDATEPVVPPDSDYETAKADAREKNKQSATLITSDKLSCGCPQTPAPTTPAPPTPATTPVDNIAQNVDGLTTGMATLVGMSAGYALTNV